MLLDLKGRVILSLHSSLPLIIDQIKFLFLELSIVLFIEEVGGG